MDKKDRLYKLFQGSETAIWAHDEIVRQDKRIAELEQDRKDLIEEFAEAECMGDLAKIVRNYGYEG